MIIWRIFNRHGHSFITRADAAETAIEAVRPLFASNWIATPWREVVPDPAFAFEGMRAVPLTVGGHIGQPVGGGEPALYAAARAGAARSLREVEAEAAGLGIGLVAELAGWQAEQLERWTPFTAMADSAFRPHHAPPNVPGACYEASFGWVHVRPGCRCAR